MMGALADKWDAIVVAGTDPGAEEFADMSIWATGTPEQKVKVAEKYVNMTGRIYADWDQNVIKDADGNVIFPPQEMVDQYNEQVATEIARQAEGQPSVGVGTRAQRSIKFAEAAKRELVEAEEGRVVGTPEGQVALTEEGPRSVDKPPMMGQAIAWALPAVFPPMTLYGPILGEILDPGTTRETVGDVADWTGEAIEVAPELATEVAMRRAGVGNLARIPTQAGAAAVGTGVRMIASDLLPGEDIDPLSEEFAQAVAMNAGGSVAGEAIVAAGARVPVPGKHLGGLKSTIGKAMLGGGSLAEVQAVEAAAKRMNITLDPFAKTLTPEANLVMGIIRNTPGLDADWIAKDVIDAVKGAHFVQRWAEASMGMPISAHAAADRASQALDAYATKVASTEGRVVGEALDYAVARAGSRPMPIGSVRQAMDYLQSKGVPMEGLTRQLGSGDALTIEQAQRFLEALDKGMIQGLPADPALAAAATDRLRNAVLADMRAASQVPGFERAAEPLAAAAAAKEAMGLPREVQLAELQRTILGLKKGDKLEYLPRQLLGDQFSERQVEALGRVLATQDPVAHRGMLRSMFEEALSGAKPAGETVAGKRLEVAAQRAGHEVYDPEKVAQALRGSRAKLELVAGRKLDGLDDIIDIFDRLTIARNTGQPTAKMLQSEKLVGSALATATGGASGLRRAAVEVGTYGWRRKLSALAMSTDPKARELLTSLVDMSPNTPLRTIEDTLVQLAAISEREDMLFGEEDPGAITR